MVAAKSVSIEALEIRYPDLRIVDCAGRDCGKVLVGESDGTIVSGMERVYHRRNGRPYCESCADKWARSTISLSDRVREISAGARAKYEASKAGV